MQVGPWTPEGGFQLQVKPFGREVLEGKTSLKRTKEALPQTVCSGPRLQ